MAFLTRVKSSLTESSQGVVPCRFFILRSELEQGRFAMVVLTCTHFQRLAFFSPFDLLDRDNFHAAVVEVDMTLNPAPTIAAQEDVDGRLRFQQEVVAFGPLDQARRERSEQAVLEEPVPRAPSVDVDISVVVDLLDFSTDQVAFFEEISHGEGVLLVAEALRWRALSECRGSEVK